MTLSGDRLKLRQRSTSEIDQIVGIRLRHRREMLGISRKELAEFCGVSAQQIHKYEAGVSGMRPGRIIQFCRALDCPPEYLLQDLDAPCSHPPDIVKLMVQPEFLELAMMFQAIDDPSTRQAILTMVRALYSSSASQDDKSTTSAA